MTQTLTRASSKQHVVVSLLMSCDGGSEGCVARACHEFRHRCICSVTQIPHRSRPGDTYGANDAKFVSRIKLKIKLVRVLLCRGMVSKMILIGPGGEL